MRIISDHSSNIKNAFNNRPQPTDFDLYRRVSSALWTCSQWTCTNYSFASDCKCKQPHQSRTSVQFFHRSTDTGTRGRFPCYEPAIAFDVLLLHNGKEYQSEIDRGVLSHKAGNVSSFQQQIITVKETQHIFI